ncbi:MAG: NAD-dependent epimerase/dehydratase family protein [Candidatus Omnitrophota bacterium]|nr:NAD-dependent epimerase/dehydratase family protein [Candidatus Omnitrophota bacterium]
MAEVFPGDFWKNKKVLVTGGCGFLGSYLTEELLTTGAAVTVVDNLETGRMENLSSVSGKFRFVKGDLRDGGLCGELAEGMDVVLNLAGRAYGLEYSMSHHGDMLCHNTLVQLNMLEAARQKEVKRFLVVSSSCVYPDDAVIPTLELDVLTGLPEKVNEGYGWAKRVGELQARYYRKEYGMEIAICRPFNPYGGRYHWSGEKSHVMPTLVKRILDGEDPLVVWGSGNQRRTFLHARDTVRLMLMVAERHPSAEPVNIGYDDDISIKDLVSLICEVSGKKPKVLFDTSKPEGRFRKCADATLLKRVSAGYQPEIGLRDGVREMEEWYHRSFGK